MKIIYILPTLDVGGTETQTLELCEKLKDFGYSTTICCLYRLGEMAEKLKKSKTDFLCLNAKHPFDIKIFPALCKAIKNGGYGIVHSFLFDANVWGPAAARRAGAKIIISGRRNYDDWMKLPHFLMQKASNRFTDFITVNSRSIKRFVADKENFPEERIKVIYNGLNISNFDMRFNSAVPEKVKEKFGIPGNAKVIAAIANLKPSKGLFYLLEAAKNVIDNIDKEIRFLIVGQGPLKDSLVRYAEKLGISEKIIFPGLQKNIPEILSCVDVAVNSSIREGMANAVLEAMAAGKPVVATDVGGNAEMISHKISGCIVPGKDFRSISTAILDFLKNPETAAKMGKAAREKIEKEFSSTKMAENYHRFYANLPVAENK